MSEVSEPKVLKWESIPPHFFLSQTFIYMFQFFKNMGIEICTVGGYNEVGKNCTAINIDGEVVMNQA